ncbi:MAG: amino acid permease [Myxococcota bacterium]
MESQRQIGLLGATGVGVGAIVGGGIFVLAGVAFASAGPGAILAFALNGGIALLTALSFAEMSTSFPESGGTYTFAKKVLTVQAAFAVGWVLWFAYIVAAVLYALGFAEFFAAILIELAPTVGLAKPGVLLSRNTVLLFALAAVGMYTWQLARSSGGGRDYATAGKLVVFIILVVGGLWAVVTAPAGTVVAGATPWLPNGTVGLLSAMGFTFIALQGFDLIAAIAGEVKRPRVVIPRAMFLSLAAALAIYIPLLFVTATVGHDPGMSIAEMAEKHPETLMPDSVRTYLGAPGYWLVMIAAVLSTLSALAANLLAASRVALSMARDRTLPAFLARLSPRRQTPAMAVYASTLTLVAILLMLPDLATAGAAASLIFLLMFTLVHVTAYLARKRGGGEPDHFRTPLFPLVPAAGVLTCVALAAFQAFEVPRAGEIIGLWVGLGGLLYYAVFSSRAEAADAYGEGADPGLARLRGRSPLVLVPLSNPATAASMVRIAAALAPPKFGRVMLLSVLQREHAVEAAIDPNASMVGKQINRGLAASFQEGQEPETLITVADRPWPEITRVAKEHECESVLLGLPRLDERDDGGPLAEDLEVLLSEIGRDVVIVRSPQEFQPGEVRRILVPMGDKLEHDNLRTRLLGSLFRTGARDVEFLRVLPEGTPDEERKSVQAELLRLAREETPGESGAAKVVTGDDVIRAVVEAAEDTDLLILGLSRHQGRRLFRETALRIAARTEAATILVSHQGRG